MPAQVPVIVQYLQSQLGGAITIVVSLVLFAAAVYWATRSNVRDRVSAILGAAGISLLMIVITLIMVGGGWWQGPIWTIPLIVLAALYVPYLIAVFTLWLGFYRWLVRHYRRGLLYYSLIVLLFIPITYFRSQLGMSMGLVSFVGRYTIWANVILGVVVMWLSAIFYEVVFRLMAPAEHLRAHLHSTPA